VSTERTCSPRYIHLIQSSILRTVCPNRLEFLLVSACIPASFSVSRGAHRVIRSRETFLSSSEHNHLGAIPSVVDEVRSSLFKTNRKACHQTNTHMNIHPYDKQCKCITDKHIQNQKRMQDEQNSKPNKRTKEQTKKQAKHTKKQTREALAYL
jgi:hypothetical protein